MLPAALTALVNTAEPVERIVTIAPPTRRSFGTKMPVRKNRPSYEIDLKDWIAPIVTELNADAENGQEEAPTILEDYQAFSNRFSVRVVWSRWDGIPPADRVPIVLEAYKRSKRADDGANLTSARGLTPAEQRNEELLDSAKKLALLVKQ